MQLKHFAAAIVLLAAGPVCVTPAMAGICVLTVNTPGTLALSMDGTRLGSQEAGGVSSVVLVTSVGPSTVTVGAPTLTQYPAGYNPGGLSLEVAYQGAGVLSGVTQGYTTAQTAFGIPNIISAVAIALNNRAVTSTGFAPGTYQTRTVVTCS